MELKEILVWGVLFYAPINFAQGLSELIPNDQLTMVKLVDTPLIDQDGRVLHLLSEVIGSRIAVVDFVYSSCTTTCPLLSSAMSQLQRKLGSDLGNKVVLISITVDPVHDTPAKLSAYAKKFGRQEGWYWLTGKRSEVELLLRGFGASVVNPEAHQNTFLVGRAGDGRWLRYVGLPKVDDLTAMIDQFR